MIGDQSDELSPTTEVQDEVNETQDDYDITIWMTVYGGDFLKATMSFNTQEVGAYFLIMLAYWTEKGPLKNSDEELSSIARLPLEQFLRVKLKLLKGFVIENDMLRNKEWDRNIAKALKQKRASSERGRKGAEARKRKRDGG